MDAPVAGETLAFEGWRFTLPAAVLLREDATGAWKPVTLGARGRDILVFLLEHPGALVSKDAIKNSAWPNVAVAANNLTVQIATLRRVLDEGRVGDSCIQTIPGRGYRFVLRVTRLDAMPSDLMLPPTADPIALRTVSAQQRSFWHWLAAGSCGIAMTVLLAAAAWHGGWFTGRPPPPRLSVVVLPFENETGDARDNSLAIGITDDLTTDLSHVPDTFVIASETASTYEARPRDARKIGEALGVRYVLGGSVRRIETTLRVNVRLTSAETGKQLWSDRFDEPIADLAAGQEQIVTRVRSELGIDLVEIEKARSLRERPTNPDAFDLILRARSLRYRPPSLERNDEARVLLERALVLDPSSVDAMVGVAFSLIDRSPISSWDTVADMQRAGNLLMQARAIAPDSEALLNVMAQWLRKLGRFREAMAVAEELVRRFPNNEAGYFDLALSKIYAGFPEEAIPLEEKAIRLNPRSAYLFNRYRYLGFASLMLGRDSDAISFLEQSLAMNPDDNGYRQWTYRFLAAAYARAGHIAEAKHAVAEGDRLWPYDTVRIHFPDDPSSTAYAEQVRRFQDGLRLAGERDHADEDADFGVPADANLHSEFAGLTPTHAPGTTTIHTIDLARFLAEGRPVIVDTVSYSWGRSIPGAVGLEFGGLGGSFMDAAQTRLRSKMQQLTAGDLSKPVVAVGWNSERFDGRNLALRLVALGYTNVYWYRGGREAWEVAGLPETELVVQEW
jgi:adenylate cyclase